LKLNYAEPHSSFAFSFNVFHYMMKPIVDRVAQCAEHPPARLVPRVPGTVGGGGGSGGGGCLMSTPSCSAAS
jgi:hypothetical protein